MSEAYTGQHDAVVRKRPDAFIHKARYALQALIPFELRREGYLTLHGRQVPVIQYDPHNVVLQERILALSANRNGCPKRPFVESIDERMRQQGYACEAKAAAPALLEAMLHETCIEERLKSSQPVILHHSIWGNHDYALYLRQNSIPLQPESPRRTA